MNNNQIIQKQYELIRKENMEEIEARKKTLYDKLPRLKEIEDEMVKLSIDITRAILSKSNTAEVLIDKLKNKQLDLKV
ncbi:MAG TPA: hypothetical protein PLY12_04775, partial [Bacillota bacterium]|nr:hypothetical protein [Bacillota bacterium]